MTMVPIGLRPQSNFPSRPAEASGPEAPADGRVIIAFTDGSTDAISQLTTADSDLHHSQPLGPPGVHVFTVPVGREAEYAASLRHDPRVRYAEPDARITTLGDPNDKLYSQQWAPGKIGAPTAWGVTTGSTSLIVAIIDSGVDRSSPEFSGRLLTGYNFVDNSDNTNDDNGHGSHVAGVIAAAGNNANGIAGLAWGVKILPVKVLSANGGGYVSTLIAGLDYAREQGAKVANISLGTGQPSTALKEAVTRATNGGMLVVVAAGNSGATGNTPSYPAGYAEVMAVASTDSGDKRSTFSTSASYVSVAAPGSAILSTYKDGEFMIMSGTSMASPHVAGFAALIWSRFPSLSAADVRREIESTAVDLGSSGKDNEFGYGRIDANGWVQRYVVAAPTSTPVPTATPVGYSGPTPKPLAPARARIYVPSAIDERQ